MIFIYNCSSNYYTEEESEFYNYLQNEYKVYGDYKYENYDWKAARIFYRKAKAIKNGKRLMPEEVFRDFDVVDFFSKDITFEQFFDMRDRTFVLLNSNIAKKEYPEELANLQFYYDCWVLEERLYQKYSQMSRCKQGFIDTLDYLEFKLLRLTSNEHDLLEKNIDNITENKNNFIRHKKYVIYFDFDSSVLTEDGGRKMWEFMDDLNKIEGKYIINIVGHADRSGSKKYNEKLSKRRTDTIKHYLVKNGISPNIIKANWHGEIDPSVLTSNNYKEELNRRVTISIQLVQ